MQMSSLPEKHLGESRSTERPACIKPYVKPLGTSPLELEPRLKLHQLEVRQTFPVKSLVSILSFRRHIQT